MILGNFIIFLVKQDIFLNKIFLLNKTFLESCERREREVHVQEKT